MKNTKPKKSEFAYERKNFWKDAPVAEQKAAMDYAVDYKEFLNQAKTEREVAVWMEKLLKKHKFVDMHSKAGAKKVYSIFRDRKSVV